MCAARLAAADAQSPVSLGSLRDKVLLIENVADYTQMNELQRRLGPRGLVVLGFPYAKNEEILNSLKYVRPGDGFEPNFMLSEKCEGNGAAAHPDFTFLDDATALMTDPKLITRSPLCRNDVAWNFEEFLVGPDCVPVCRYSRGFRTINIESDIEALLSQGPSCA
uniref:Glutathione peroxidase 1 n=1 Tax=Nomascus leucogenys TaxID=61853 RepID=A0A2I3GW75_NOMLE